MEPLKDLYYHPRFYKELCAATKKAYPALNEAEFLSAFEHYTLLELLDRMKQVGDVLHNFLPGNFKEKLQFIYQIASEITGFTGLSFPYFVEKYGRNDYDTAMQALHFLTRFSSSEFAVRPFLKQDSKKGLAYLMQWAEDDNHHVRRLASEGCRPLLPWSFKLTEFVKQPQLTLPILNKLQHETDLYVKKSVGNHLNDISKNHPQLIINTLNEWDLNNKHSLWMAKKGVRTLIKNGHPGAFSIMGFEKEPAYSIHNFSVEKKNIKLGQSLEFSFEILSLKKQKLNIDFQVYYMKKNGQQQGKVFKLKEVCMEVNEQMSVSKKHLFENFTTRTHYAGVHFVSLLINGMEIEKHAFNLVD